MHWPATRRRANRIVVTKRRNEWAALSINISYGVLSRCGDVELSLSFSPDFLSAAYINASLEGVAVPSLCVRTTVITSISDIGVYIFLQRCTSSRKTGRVKRNILSKNPRIFLRDDAIGRRFFNARMRRSRDRPAPSKSRTRFLWTTVISRGSFTSVCASALVVEGY